MDFWWVGFVVWWFLFACFFCPVKGSGHEGLCSAPGVALFLLQLPPILKSFWLVFSLQGKGTCSDNPASLVCCRHQGCCHRLFSAVPAALTRGMCCLQHFIPSVCPAQGAVCCIAALFLRRVLHQAAQGMRC